MEFLASIIGIFELIVYFFIPSFFIPYSLLYLFHGLSVSSIYIKAFFWFYSGLLFSSFVNMCLDILDEEEDKKDGQL